MQSKTVNGPRKSKSPIPHAATGRASAELACWPSSRHRLHPDSFDTTSQPLVFISGQGLVLLHVTKLSAIASCKHALTSALAATKALDEGGDRGGRRDRHSRQYIRGQHTEVTAPQTLDPHAFPARHATSSTTTRPCSGLKHFLHVATTCTRRRSILLSNAKLPTGPTRILSKATQELTVLDTLPG
jgi:hypothetical protein